MAAGAIACGSAGDSSSTLRNAEFHLVALEYPVPGEGDSTICAQYERKGNDGLRYVIREEYDFPKMRDALAEGTEWGTFAQSRGLTTVRTCDDAREFDQLWFEYTETKPSEGANPGIPQGATEPQ